MRNLLPSVWRCVHNACRGCRGHTSELSGGLVHCCRLRRDDGAPADRGPAVPALVHHLQAGQEQRPPRLLRPHVVRRDPAHRRRPRRAAQPATHPPHPVARCHHPRERPLPGTSLTTVFAHRYYHVVSRLHTNILPLVHPVADHGRACAQGLTKAETAFLAQSASDGFSVVWWSCCA